MSALPIAIIPARGNSQRLPRKNFLPLAGVPLLARVIKAARESGVFSKIIVSSEDTEALELAQGYGAIAHKRPFQLSIGKSTVLDVCLEVMDLHNTHTFCCIYATAALISKDTIKESYQSFIQNPEVDVLMGVSQYNFHPVQALTINESGYLESLFPDYESLQSQDYPQALVSNGTLYWANFDAAKENRTFYVKRLAGFEIPEHEVCDVDTIEDYNVLRKRFEC